MPPLSGTTPGSAVRELFSEFAHDPTQLPIQSGQSPGRDLIRYATEEGLGDAPGDAGHRVRVPAE